MSLGKYFVAAAIADDDIEQFVQHGPIDHLFKNTEVPVFEYVQKFVRKYSKLPSVDTVEKHTGEDILIPDHLEPAGYYFDLLQQRHTEHTLKKAMEDASKKFLPEEKDPEAALQIIAQSVMELMASKYSTNMIDFRHAYDMVVNDYISQYTKEDNNRLLLGWPYLDDLSGGLTKGDLLSFVGRPGKGKTWNLLYAAMHGWRDRKTVHKGKELVVPGSSRLFVSMEMKPLPIMQRMAAMEFKLKSSDIDKATLASAGFTKLKNGMMAIQNYASPFWVVDGNLAATVDDLVMLAQQLKPDAIFIDGAYLLKHPHERDRYRRVAENADLIKQELCALAPTVCSWQFARSGSAKAKKKGDSPDLDDIGYTDAIAQLSSLVLALLDKDSVETMNQRRINILKGRKGETGEFMIHWDFSALMNFTQVEEEDVSELQFL